MLLFKQYIKNPLFKLHLKTHIGDYDWLAALMQYTMQANESTMIGEQSPVEQMTSKFAALELETSDIAAKLTPSIAPLSPAELSPATAVYFKEGSPASLSTIELPEGRRHSPVGTFSREEVLQSSIARRLLPSQYPIRSASPVEHRDTVLWIERFSTDGGLALDSVAADAVLQDIRKVLAMPTTFDALDIYNWAQRNSAFLERKIRTSPLSSQFTRLWQSLDWSSVLRSSPQQSLPASQSRVSPSTHSGKQMLQEISADIGLPLGTTPLSIYEAVSRYSGEHSERTQDLIARLDWNVILATDTQEGGDEDDEDLMFPNY